MSPSKKSFALAVTVAAISLLASGRASAADTICTGTITGTHDNVVVSGGTCTLSSATVLGSVTVTGGGALTMSGTTQINGDIQAFGAGTITLNSGTVNGAVSLLSSGAITVGAGANLNALSVTDSGNMTVRGSLEKINAVNSGGLTITGTAARIAAGVIVDAGKAGTTVCGGATIVGGIIMMNTTGGLSVGIGTCGVNTIDGAVLVSKGSGAVRISNAVMTGSDVSVSEQIGNVILTNLSLSDVTVENLTGSVTWATLRTDSDSKILNISSTVSITNGNFQGDVEINTAQAITISGNNFNFEDVNISKGTGSLTITNNTNIGINVTERGTVTFSGNRFDFAEFSKNGALSVTNNIGTTLLCVDNAPAPTGSGNTITTKTGQCSSV